MKNILLIQSGFTIVEYLIGIGIVAILLSVIGLNILGGRESAVLSSTLDTLVADVTSQQLKSMTQKTVASQRSSYGVKFEATRYILFYGDSYSSNDPRNFVINLEENISFSPVNVPNEQIVFASSSGEILGFSPSQKSVTITNAINGQTKIIEFNRLGVISNVQ